MTDSTFRSGPLADRTVNIKAYGDASTGLDISDHLCDFYLVLSGPPQPTGSRRHRPWHIAAIYLFDAHALRNVLAERGVKIGIATSLRRADLDTAGIYPAPSSTALLSLSDGQQAALAHFAPPPNA